MDDQIKQNLINNTKEFLAKRSLGSFGGLCGKLANHDDILIWNDGWCIVRQFMASYISAGKAYISLPYEVTPERIKAAEHFLEWLESQ